MTYVLNAATASMQRLSDEARRECLNKLGTLCIRRAQGTSEGQIAQEPEFTDSSGAPSARVMYERLQEDWNLPNWLVYPDGMGESADTAKERKASSGGDVKKLPAAKQAEHLFRTDLKRLIRYLDKIPDLGEHLQGKLYAWFSWVGEDWEEYYRNNYSEEDWEQICHVYGEDPAQEAFRFPILPYTHHGGRPAPWKGLTLLIALHVLMHERRLDRLVSALHPDPASVNLVEWRYARRCSDRAPKSS